MRSPLSVAQVRELDRRTIEEVGVPGRLLMEVAGFGAFAVALEMLGRQDPPGSGPVSVLGGKGNNAGDGFVLARFCAATGIPVRVIALEDPAGLRGDARANFDLLASFGVDVALASPATLQRELDSCRLIVDGLLGTGVRSAVRSPFREAIEAMNASSAPTLALDLPSGLCGDSGEVLGNAVRADETATFGALKRGLQIGSGPRYAGRVHVVPLPFAPRIWPEAEAPAAGSE